MVDLQNSMEWYKRGQKVLAGPSTFSKGPDQFAFGITPYALDRAKGAYLWDVDGNEYLDTMMALGAAFLGYRHPYVEEAITKQLEKGVSFPLVHAMEVEVAEMLCERIPCAEMVRFGKNGSDATSAAVRLSRYVTGRNHILFCGYHGWQEWYSCQTSMNGGILEDVKEYSHRFPYNDLEELENLLNRFHKDTACIIMEPVSRITPKEGYLEGVRDLATKHGSVLIFDEIITGFRMHRGGYQALSGVIPDLACFSKALGNGMPISALVGKSEIMSQCPEIYFSLTFAGETLSLAAAKAVMECMDKEDVTGVIHFSGSRLLAELCRIIDAYDLNSVIVPEGFAHRHVLIFHDYNDTSAVDIRTLWIQELIKRRIVSTGTQFPSLAHGEKEVNSLVECYDEILRFIKETLETKKISDRLQCPQAKITARDL